MYRTSEGLISCVGFRGYAGGAAKRLVNDESDCASTGDTMGKSQMIETSLQ
jgi:hypothetical protein